VYVLDNEPFASGDVDGQILPFTVGTNGTLNSLVGGAIAGDQTETDPLFVLTESKGKYCTWPTKAVPDQ